MVHYNFANHSAINLRPNFKRLSEAILKPTLFLLTIASVGLRLTISLQIFRRISLCSSLFFFQKLHGSGDASIEGINLFLWWFCAGHVLHV